MSTSYSLKVLHTGTETGDFCVYQTNDRQQGNICSLVWFKKRAHPNTAVYFNWNIDYSFTWSESGILKPGVVFRARDTVSSDYTDSCGNTISFTQCNDGFVFQETDEQTTQGRMGIACDENVPAKTASIGIAMSGKPAFACSASPNIKFTFKPHPRYWIAFGKFDEGEVLDLSRLTNKAEIVFKTNQNKKIMRLSETNKWIDESK